MKTKVFNFNLPDEFRTYLKKRAKDKFTTMSDYLIRIIDNDKENHEYDNGDLVIEEKTPYESNIIHAIASKYAQEIMFEIINVEKIEKDLSEIILKFTNIDHLVKCKTTIKGCFSIEIKFKCESEDNKFRVLNVEIMPSGVLSDTFI